MFTQYQARAWLGSVVSIAFVSASFALEAGATTRHFSSGLPLLHLKTSKGAVIGKDPIPTQVTLLDEAVNESRDLFSRAPSFSGEVEIRGFSSAKFRKRQFDLELKDPQDKEKDLKASLLGLPAHSKWVLSSQYMDRSLIRNPLAYAIASEMPLPEGKAYAPRFKPIELFINGQYQGVYYLGEKIDISKNRLNISKPDFTRSSESTFMVKVEKKKTLLPDEFFYTWGKENKAAFYEPKAKKIREMMKKNPEQAKQMVNHIRGKFRDFEFALMAIEQGDRHSYRSQIEIESFQNFILLQEVFKNLDGFRRSLNLYYEGGKMHIGPVWDFDLSAGNILVFGQGKPEGFQSGHHRYIDANPEMQWFRYLLSDPRFARDLVARYKQLRKPGEALSDEMIFGHLNRLKREVREGTSRNFARWSPNPSLKDGPLSLFVPKYASGFRHSWAVTDLENFLKQRLRWLDRNIYNIGMNDRPRFDFSPFNATVGTEFSGMENYLPVSEEPDASLMPTAEE